MTQLILTNAKYQFLGFIRVPIAVIGAAFFPAAAMVFFVVPFAGGDPVAATFATASMVVFAIMSSGLFQYGIGISEDRELPWDPYTRTLPAGPFPRFAGRILTGVAFMLLSLVPVLIVAVVATDAFAMPGQILLAIGAVLIASLPFTLLGFAIGYALPSKAALAVAQLLFLPLAFGGGLFAAPGQSPGFVEIIAPYLPTRGAVELVWSAVGNFTVNQTSLVMLAVWIVVAGVLAMLAYRRDEGRRFS